VLLSATVLGLAGCVNAEQPAPPGAGDSVSYGAPPASTTAAESPSTTASGGATQAADVTFVKQALLLRQQQITMAAAAATSSTNSQVKALAATIKNDSVPSVTTLTGLLSQWGQQPPTATTDRAPGVLTSSQLSQLSSAKGTAFDMQWLQYMRANLQAAKNAAQTERSQGTSSQAKQLAQQWSSTLDAELATANGIH
jgi:uncharacterized protein (DUF305 family)